MIPTSAIDQLRRALSPRAVLYTPASPGYDQHRAVVNRRFDKRPGVIVSCATESDVAATVKFARDLDVMISIRAGGCSPAGFSSNDGGVLLDLSLLQTFAIDPTKTSVQVGGGVVLSAAYAAAAAAGCMIVSGECKPVGVSGITLGGGFSLLGRSLGLACDNLLGATIVTASGDVLTVNAHEHADLFWALRGGGCGNFGVVTSLQLKLHTLAPAVFTSVTAWPLAQAAAILTDALAWFANEAPDELNAVWAFANDPQGNPCLLMVGVYNGSPAKGEAAMARLTSLGKPSMSQPATQPFSALLAADFPAPVESIHDYFRSGFVTGPLPHSAAELLAERFRTIPQKGTKLQNMIFFELAGGAVNRVAADATAFVHRRHTVLLSLLSTWEGAAGVSDPAEKRWNDALYSELAPYYSGEVYQNYPDINLTNWADAYYGANLTRLVAVKRQYDPGNVFRFAQSIPVR